MSWGEALRRLLFLLVLALFLVFVLAPAAIFTVVASGVLSIPWWVPALASALWLIVRARMAWQIGAPGAPEPCLDLPRRPGDPTWDLVLTAAHRAGSDEPTAIELVAVPNAEVQGRDGGVVLLLGLPYLACCSKAEIAAIVAHELSHASLGHLRSWRFEQRWMAAVVRLVNGSKPGFQRLALRAHVRLAEFVVLPDKRRDETQADRAATHSAGADSFASSLLRTESIEVAWSRGEQFYFDVPAMAGLRCSSLAGVRDLTAAMQDQPLDLAPDGLWSTHPGNARRLQLAGSTASATLAPADKQDLVLPWPELQAAERTLRQGPSATYPAAAWDDAWPVALVSALREMALDAQFAWSIRNGTPRAMLQHAAGQPDQAAHAVGSGDPREIPLAVAALAAVQQGAVEFDWTSAARIADLSTGLAGITATGRGTAGRPPLPLAVLSDAPLADYCEQLEAIGVDLDRSLDLSRAPKAPAQLRAVVQECTLDAKRTTIALPAGRSGRQPWMGMLLNTGLALVAAQPERTAAAYFKQLDNAMSEVVGLGWRPDPATIWIAREAVSGVRLEKRRSRVAVTTDSGTLCFVTKTFDFDPMPFVGLWGADRVSA